MQVQLGLKTVMSLQFYFFSKAMCKWKQQWLAAHAFSSGVLVAVLSLGITRAKLAPLPKYALWPREQKVGMMKPETPAFDEVKR